MTMLAGNARIESDWPTRAYALLAGLFLLAQGASTLAARLVPSVDRAMPWLLGLTQMIAVHSSLHLATAVLAGLAIATRQTRLFAFGFGIFYTGLALTGWATGSQLCLGLQPFDHPFHLVLGGLGLFAAVWEIIRNRNRETPP
jgi:hypothetical protein